MTTGQVAAPSYIAPYLAMWFVIWSKHSARKSPNMISAIGRRPARARPAETPAIAASLIGIARTRSGKSVLNPRVTLKAPPYGSRTSSPSTTTRASDSSAWRSVSPRARA